MVAKLTKIYGSWLEFNGAGIFPFKIVYLTFSLFLMIILYSVALYGIGVSYCYTSSKKCDMNIDDEKHL